MQQPDWEPILRPSFFGGFFLVMLVGRIWVMAMGYDFFGGCDRNHWCDFPDVGRRNEL